MGVEERFPALIVTWLCGPGKLPAAETLVRTSRTVDRRIIGLIFRLDRLLPDVPTMAEAGLPGFAISAWFGMLAPAKTPPEILNKLHAETVKALAAADTKERFANLGFEPISSTPAEFRRFIAAEAAKLGPVIRAAGMKPE